MVTWTSSPVTSDVRRPSYQAEVAQTKVLDVTTGQPIKYIKAVKVSGGRYAAIQAATEGGEVACGTRPRKQAPAAEGGTDLKAVTCRTCCAELGTDDRVNEGRRLEALFVLSIALGLRPGELRKLSWDLTWTSAPASSSGGQRAGPERSKTEKSRRSLVLPKRAAAALVAHRKLQAAERLAAGAAWQDSNLVFCYQDGRMYSKDALNWRFGKMTRPDGIGHWHAHEGRHCCVDHEQQWRAAAGD